MCGRRVKAMRSTFEHAIASDPGVRGQDRLRQSPLYKWMWRRFKAIGVHIPGAQPITGKKSVGYRAWRRKHKVKVIGGQLVAAR